MTGSEASSVLSNPEPFRGAALDRFLAQGMPRSRFRLSREIAKLSASAREQGLLGLIIAVGLASEPARPQEIAVHARDHFDFDLL